MKLNLTTKSVSARNCYHSRKFLSLKTNKKQWHWYIYRISNPILIIWILRNWSRVLITKMVWWNIEFRLVSAAQVIQLYIIWRSIDNQPILLTTIDTLSPYTRHILVPWWIETTNNSHIIYSIHRMSNDDYQRAYTDVQLYWSVWQS